MIIRRVVAAAAILASTTAFTYDKPAARAVPHSGNADQCAKPLSKRQGGWLCMTSASKQLPAVKGKCRFISPLGKGRAWCRRDDLLSEFRSTGAIGFGKGVLGSVTVSFTVTLKLKQAHSLPVSFRTTARHVTDLAVQGNRLYYTSSCSAGCAVKPSVAEQHKFSGPVPRNHTISWPHGYKATEKPVHDGAVFHQWTFHVHGYPGHWFVFAKSIHYKFAAFKDGHLSDRSEFYEAGTWQKRLGVNPAGGGWTQ